MRLREVKFRLWLDNEMLSHEQLIRMDQDTHAMYTIITKEKQEEGTVLMQYTGLKGKDGVEVYEGDVLPCRYVVTFVDGSDGGNLGMASGWYEQRDNFESWRQLEVGDELEVIGNIYEHSHLLNKS